MSKQTGLWTDSLIVSVILISITRHVKTDWSLDRQPDTDFHRHACQNRLISGQTAWHWFPSPCMSKQTGLWIDSLILISIIMHVKTDWSLDRQPDIDFHHHACQNRMVSGQTARHWFPSLCMSKQTGLWIDSLILISIIMHVKTDGSLDRQPDTDFHHYACQNRTVSGQTAWHWFPSSCMSKQNGLWTDSLTLISIIMHVKTDWSLDRQPDIDFHHHACQNRTVSG